MSQNNVRSDCSNGNHHEGQDRDDCECNCPNQIRGNHLNSNPFDVKNSRPSNNT